MLQKTDPQFRSRVDAMLNEMISDFYRNVPYADHLKSAKQVNAEYFKRFTTEIILRLRMKRTIDALTIHYFTKHDPKLAKKWSHYTEDEMLHDSMFLADLKRLGMSSEEVYSTEPLFATKLLQGYFYYGLEHEGIPLASLSSSYFIEYTSGRTQEAWLGNVGESLGGEAVKGSRAHVSHDDEDDHVTFVWEVLSTFIKTPADEEKVLSHLRNIYHLFAMFFIELYNLVVKNKSEAFAGVYQMVRPEHSGAELRQ
jgi:hypothetical protein